MKGLYGLVGMKFRTPADRVHLATLPNGSPLVLKREPNNEFDPFAVQVWSGEHHIGYIKGSQVRPLAMAMDAMPSTIDGQPNESALPVMPGKLAIDGGKWPLVEVEE